MLNKPLKVIGCCLIFWSQVSLAEGTTMPLLEPGQQLFQQGDYANAISRWETALKTPQLDTATWLDTVLHLSAAYQALGDYASAYALLQPASQRINREGTAEQQVLVTSYLADTLLATQQATTAKTLLEKQLPIARRLNNPLLLAHLLNNLGNVLSVQQQYPQATQIYTEVVKLAQSSGQVKLQIQALINQALAFLKLQKFADSLTTLETAFAKVQTLPNNYDKGMQLLSLGQLALKIQRYQPTTLQTAYRIINLALQLGERQLDQQLLSYAKGLLGEVYERQHRYPEALSLTRQAIFAIQDRPEMLYLWEWQQGRLLLAQQDLSGAVAAYQRARDHLYPIQTRLVIGQRNVSELFQERIRPVYFGFADVLLQHAAKSQDSSTKQQLLNQAREVLEQLKAAELQDYFQEECVSAIQGKAISLDGLEAHTSVVYPILLPTRTELLFTLPEGIQQIVVPVGAEELGQTILEFRKNLQTSTHSRFIKQAKQLYDWLIAPLHEQLLQHQIDTLVIVPDGPLRTIPMAALYNSTTQKFLIQELAIAITPGLNLTEPRPLVKQKLSILLNGLSEGVQSFSPLPNVPKEIQNVKTLFINQQAVLMDKAFLLEGINKEMQQTPFAIVHLASHGQFDSDPKKTFVLTYDDKLTMNRLENLLRFTELRREPVELLTLSACQTAVGDERAALGLAGVAVKAGARSALATLWFVNDESTAELVTEFYQQLQKPVMSKAKALQQAQQKLLESEHFRHPMYWSPFLLIGNWL